jgi:hypothetical protein
MDYINIILIFIVGFTLGMHVMKRIVLRKIQKLLDQPDEDAAHSVKKLFIETINDILYLYEFETNTFICQGKTLDELAARIKDTTDVAVVKYKEDVLFFIVGEVRKSI